MPVYTVHFGHDHGFSEAEVQAPDAAHAIEMVKIMPENELIFCEHYDVGNNRDYIRVEDKDGNETEYYSPELAAKRHSLQLLKALETIYQYAEAVLGPKSPEMIQAKSVLDKISKSSNAGS